MTTDTQRNIADALAEHLPKPQSLAIHRYDNERTVEHLALPAGWTAKTFDNEEHLASPSRTKAIVTLTDHESFIEYVKAFATEPSIVWCNFNPSKAVLEFRAVIDEHGPAMPGWRSHQAVFTPALSHEWNVWVGGNKQPKEQVAFAEFLEEREPDIHAVEGYPTSLQLMSMATEFVARQELRIKSVTKLQSGGTQLEYINDADTGTTERMKAFDRLAIAIPVFWTVPKADEAVPAYPIRARLKYRWANQKVTFHYELIRHDLVYQAAALSLIEQISEGIGGTAMLCGSST